jgi:hypothetical protein
MRDPEFTSLCLRAALHYAREFDWKMFPARMEGGKKYSWLSKAHAPEGLNWGMTSNLEQLSKNFSVPFWRNRCGIGLPTGAVNRIFVLEFDTPKGHGVDGAASLQRMETEHGKLPSTLMGRSPTGSVHRFFKHPGPGFKVKSIDAVAGYHGVDCKGDGGMVVIPPSLRADGPYEWLNDEEIADAPQWLLDLVSGDAADTPIDFDMDDPFLNAAREQNPPASIAEVQAALAVVPNDDVPWGDWNRIGMAVFSNSPDADGLDAFDAWSQKSSKYDRHRTADKWRAFKGSPPRNISVGTIFWLATEAEADWRDSIEDEDEDEDEIGEAPQSNGHDKDARVHKARLMQTSTQFVAGFVPPDYLIDGLLQRRYVYSFTGPTGSGKTAIALLLTMHVAYGLSLGDRAVEKGRVLFFAGENPDDIRTRWIRVCEEFGVEPETDAVDVVFMPFTPKLSEKKIRQQIDIEAMEHGPFALLIVDTSAAYYSGDDENDNKKLGDHARLLRSFVNLPGGPTVIVTCHPTKTPDMENLLPRGGGAFLAEVDGNLVCISDSSSKTAIVTTHGKFRGPEFVPFNFKLTASTSDKLVDSKGRSVWTVTAQLIDDDELDEIAAQEHTGENLVLVAMSELAVNSSLNDIAEHLGWRTTKGDPNKQRVQRSMLKLKRAKLVETRRNGRYILTKKGEREVDVLLGRENADSE